VLHARALRLLQRRLLPRLQRREKLRIANLGIDFGWGFAHGAVSRCPPISLDTIEARTEGYAYDARVWDLSFVQDQFLSRRAKP
jgi:hypothetical protein